MALRRKLVVVADDFGIGPETDRAILELARDGLVTSTVLMVNSPHAEAAIAAWNRFGRPVELGWHPVLTCDSPILPAEQLPSLVDSEGQFRPLGQQARHQIGPCALANGEQCQDNSRQQQPAACAQQWRGEAPDRREICGK